MPAPWEESYDKPRQCNKKQRQKKKKKELLSRSNFNVGCEIRKQINMMQKKTFLYSIQI